MTEAPPDPTDPTSSRGQVRLRRLKINQYRNIKPGTELHFDDGFNLLLGQNGTGKTTLLRLIAELLGTSQSLLREVHDIEYDLAFPQFTCTVSGTASRPKPEADEEAFPRKFPSGALAPALPLDQHWGVSMVIMNRLIQVRSDRNRLVLSVDGEEQKSMEIMPHDRAQFLRNALRLITRPSRVGEHSVSYPYWVVGHEQGLGEALTATEQLWDLSRFDESLLTFSAFTGSVTPEDERTSAPSIAAISTAPHKEFLLLSSRAIPEIKAQIWDQIMAGVQHDQRADVSLTEAQLSFLRHASGLLGFQTITMALRFREKELSQGQEVVQFGPASFWLTRKDGSIIPHDLLSYGQKRLLAFLYYLELCPHVVIADELVNGFHHRWIRECLAKIEGRQAFLTSQNPLLLDYVPPDSVEQARRQYILCSVQPREEGPGEEILWRNMSVEEAERFFRAAKVGIQSVSEVLETKGLW